MKKTLLLVISLCTSALLHAQVSLSVGAIEVDQPVTITLDINNTTDTDCNGFNNPTKVYMHSGIGDNSNAFGFSVVGNWGQDDGVGQMTSNGDGTYSITITPQSYYGLTQMEADNATQMGMVFRNEDGTQELKADGCNDFIFAVGLVNVNITSPSSSTAVVSNGGSLNITATMTFQGSTAVGSFEVFLDNTSIASGSGFPTYSTTLNNLTQSGTIRVVGTPQGQSETGESSFDLVIAPSVTEEAMAAGLVDGINYDADPTKATLVLDAPGKEFVYVAGSFNNYDPTSGSFVMKRDPGTQKFWFELNGLTSGQIYTYQYWVYDTNPVPNSPAEVKTADPYSTLVLSPFDDPGIPSTTYPNIPTYPAGQEREVTVLQTNQSNYPWVINDFNGPKEEDLIIYEVLVRDFDADRNYQDLIDRIDYFKNLNINAIQLMPVMEYEGNESWGYNTSFHMALDKFYGTETKFKEFIDLCHQNGIAVILDIALNHAFGRNPMVRMWMDDPDDDGWGGPSSENPYFNQVATHSYSVGSDFDHSNAKTQNYVQRVVKHWIEEFKIDGFRWDLTKGFTQNCSASDEGCTNSYQQDRVDRLKAYADYSWSLDPDHYVIFEHLGSDNEEQQWANYRLGEGKGIMMWGKMTDPYNQLTMGYASNSNIDRMGHVAHGFSGKRLVGYAESHDEERLMYKNTQFGNDSNGAHNVTNLNTALSRMPALGAVTLTIPGPKMIWHFGELGMNNSIFTCSNGTVNEPGGGDGDCKLDTKPQPQWTNNWLGDPNRSPIYNAWQRINNLKINEPVFEGNYSISSGNLTPKIYIWDDAIPSNMLKNVVVLANFDVTAQNVTPDFPYTGTWYELMDASGTTSLNVTNTASPINLQPGEFRIYGNALPETLSTGTAMVASEFMLFPNPVSTSFSVNQNVSELVVYDITGKRVKQFSGTFEHGHVFDISELSQSLYIIKVKNALGIEQSAKLIKL